MNSQLRLADLGLGVRTLGHWASPLAGHIPFTSLPRRLFLGAGQRLELVLWVSHIRDVVSSEHSSSVSGATVSEA